MSRQEKSPPKAAKWIISRLEFYEKNFALTDSIEEDYSRIRSKNGMFRSWRWYWLQVMYIVIKYFNLKIIMSAIMIKNYFKISLRNLLRHKGFSLITISGLTVGYAVFILTFLFSSIALNYDNMHEDAERIYCITQVKTGADRNELHTAITPAPLKEVIDREFPEIVESTRFFRTGRKIVSYKNENFYESKIIFADNSFLTFFKNKMISGNIDSALDEPYSIVLTKSKAEKYFGIKDPIGQTLRIDKDFEVKITGVIDDISNFSGLTYDFILSLELAQSLYAWMDSWNYDSQMTFIKLSEYNDADSIEERLPQFLNTNMARNDNPPERLYLFPMTSLTFHSWDISTYWRKDVILPLYAFYGMGLILLLIVCINFMSMSTARYSARAREIGVRKVVGAQRTQLARQFIFESVVIAFLALPAGILLFEVIRPAFIAFYEYWFIFSLWDHPQFLVTLIIMTFATGIISGFYPAVFLSGFRPVSVLKGTGSSGVKGGRLKKVLVVTQFMLSSILIISAIVIQNQYNFLREIDLGYNRENVLYIEFPDDMNNDLDLFNKEAEKHSSVTASSLSAGLPGSWYVERKIVPEGNSDEEYISMHVYEVDHNFTGLLNMKIISGRNFSEDFEDDNNFIISELAAEKLGWDDPVGKNLFYRGKSGKIVGIIKDFNFRYVEREVKPSILCLRKDNLDNSLIKISHAEDEHDVAEFLKTVWNRMYTGMPFEYDTLEELNFRQNQGTQKGYQITIILGIVTIFIASLGLFGLVTFIIQGKIREIGIRKVLGASAASINRKFLKNFLRLVFIANIIASPFAYYLSKLFIENMYFSYAHGINISVFLFAALITVISAMTAIFYQVYRAAMINPTDTLRYE
ncbi:ABC transporter permease [candidate division KSB1 bacterium]